MSHANYISPDGRYVYIAQDEADARHEAAEEALADAFFKAAMAGDMKAVAWFAGMTPDYSKPIAVGAERPMRHQTVGDVMEEALGYGNPTMPEALDILAAVAGGKSPDSAARKLIERMAGRWASMNVEAA